MLKLNLGSGGKKLPGYLNVDSQPLQYPDVVLDIGRDKYPWQDNSVDEIQIWHVLEHLPGECFFHCLQEMYRVCKPGAIIGVVVPHPRHDVFLNDPTHVRAVTPDTLAMFSKKHNDQMIEKGGRLTPFYLYYNVDFEILSPIQLVVDPKVDVSDPDWEKRERHENNIIVEYSFEMKVVK